jgi:hypothetical protein
MPALTRRRSVERRQQKITFDEMRASGVRGLLIYCSDYRCSHSTAISGDRWPDDIRLSDLELRFTCQACGTRAIKLGWLLLHESGTYVKFTPAGAELFG